MDDMKDKKNLADALDRIRIEHTIEGDDGDCLEYAALTLEAYAMQKARMADCIEKLEALLSKSQAVMVSAFADPDELKFSVKSMDGFAECIANNRQALGDSHE